MRDVATFLRFAEGPVGLVLWPEAGYHVRFCHFPVLNPFQKLVSTSALGFLKWVAWLREVHDGT